MSEGEKPSHFVKLPRGNCSICRYQRVYVGKKKNGLWCGKYDFKFKGTLRSDTVDYSCDEYEG